MSGEVQGSGGRPDIRRILNLLAAAFLVASLLLLIGFHFLPADPRETKELGWEIWKEVWDICKNPEELSQDPPVVIAVISFITFVGLIVVSPFLVGFFRKSRVLWWMATILSGIATFGFAAVILPDIGMKDWGSGLACLFASPVLNLIGLLLIRGDKRTLPGPQPEACEDT